MSPRIIRDIVGMTEEEWRSIEAGRRRKRRLGYVLLALAAISAISLLRMG